MRSVYITYSTNLRYSVSIDFQSYLPNLNIILQ